MKPHKGRTGVDTLRAFIVEDNEHMRTLLRTLLNAMHIRDVLEFKDGTDALAQLSMRKPDFILTDFSMAPMDGIAFIRAVRQSKDQTESVTPIIMVTGHSERSRVETARDSGVTEILAKPITAAGLFSRIEEIVYRPRPFVRNQTYYGPCRRRRVKADYAGPWRRKDDANSTDSETDLVIGETGKPRANAAG